MSPSQPESSPASAAAPPSAAERLARLQWAAALPAQLSDLDFDLDVFMRTLVERVMAVTTATGVIVELVDDDHMVYRAASPDLSAHLGLHLPRQGSLSGLCVEQGRLLECRDSETDPRVDRDACRRIGLRSMLCAPIVSGGQAVGVLKALWDRPDGFAAHDLEVLDLLAGSLAAALAKQVAFEALYRESEARREQAEILAVARARAEAAAAANADFLANMSHEIRTPLTAVVGFAGLLAACDLPPDARRYVERITGASNTLLGLVNDVLDLSKLQAGELDLRPRRTDVVALGREVLGLFEAQAAAKGVALVFETDDAKAFPAVELDDRALRQVLTNLLGNAAKFTDEGEIRLSLGWRRGRLSATVRDTGAGMTLDAQARLFQRFQQGEDTAGPRSGTGLGLAISRALVELMDGQIGVTSQAGRGSAFHFEIGAPAVGQAERDAPPALADLTGVRLLVADDGPANRGLVRALAEAAGAEVTEAADGLEAVRLAQRQPFDIILMDRRMPGLDGVAAATRLRSEAGPNADIPILVFSANAMDAHEPVFDGLILKPVSAAALTDAISRALDAVLLPLGLAGDA